MGGERSSPRGQISRTPLVVGNSAAAPAIVKDGRMMQGKPIGAWTWIASSRLWRWPNAHVEPILRMALRNRSRVLGLSMAPEAHDQFHAEAREHPLAHQDPGRS